MAVSVFKCGESREKVYCNECKWFEEYRSIQYFSQKCGNPKNLGNWRDRYTKQKSPKEINKQNDCSWFEKLEITPSYLKRKFKEMRVKFIGD